MKSKKIKLGTLTAILSIGLLFGCGTTNDEQGSETNEKNSEDEKNRKSF